MAKNVFLPAGSIEIQDGPGKFDLMCSNFDFKQVQFTCEHNGRQFKLGANILFAYPEDGSKERWIGMISICNPDEKFSFEDRAYYYDSKKRKGSISQADRKWKIGTL